MSLWPFMGDGGSHLLSRNLSLYFWLKVWRGLNMTLGKCLWVLVCGNLCVGFFLFYSWVALKVYLLSSLGSFLWLLIFCLLFSRCRWWAGKNQSANIIRVCTEVLMTATVFIVFTVPLLFKWPVLCVFSICNAFCLRCNKLWLSHSVLRQTVQQRPSVSGPVRPDSRFLFLCVINNR